MRLTVKNMIKTIYEKLVRGTNRIEIDRTTPYLTYTAQVSLVALQMRWTKIIQEALEDKTSRMKGLENPKQEINSYREALTRICKDNDWNKLNRTKLETLVLIAVYLVEVTS